MNYYLDKREEDCVIEKFYNKEFCIEVSGDYACFTRPEMKVERVSYDVITPSAARGVFEAIFWKPAIRWQVTKIEVLSPIKWISVRRNEVGALISDRVKELFIEPNRQQRAGLFLRDVIYRLHAELVFINPLDRKKIRIATLDTLIDSEEKELLRKDENPGKYNAIFERRAKKGQCFNQPYLGCREFSAAFRYIENISEETIRPINETRDLGYMLYDMDFSDINDPKPMFFRAKIENGVVTVPPIDSEEVKR
ncbi:MAG TPA: type I-C CRISPR-associated protein Cas5 [Candidatus Margulisbacteria bacterium]|nr:MAG: type I-C CRISPR-associated protein Cas5 [Candidatus Margulisbacteria bacterium GWD2_39_127]HAR64193.1 type I-C CRISPR-associated protein Cas5 [Candidatus Margulisiibacteriota bacterium]